MNLQTSAVHRSLLSKMGASQTSHRSPLVRPSRTLPPLQHPTLMTFLMCLVRVILHLCNQEQVYSQMYLIQTIWLLWIIRDFWEIWEVQIWCHHNLLWCHNKTWWCHHSQIWWCHHNHKWWCHQIQIWCHNQIWCHHNSLIWWWLHSLIWWCLNNQISWAFNNNRYQLTLIN